jgi:hypothetical protein
MDYAGLALLIVLTLVFAFLTAQMLRARRRWFWVGALPLGGLTLLFGAATVLAFVGYQTLNTVYPNPPSPLNAQLTP